MTGRRSIDLGASCEKLASIFLVENGYRVIGQNIRLGRGEIDIIATREQVICFIEVKASITLKFGLPEERVDRRKQKQLIKLAKLFLQKNTVFQKSYDPRFDVISIIKKNNYNNASYEISHITDAFRL